MLTLFCSFFIIYVDYIEQVDVCARVHVNYHEQGLSADETKEKRGPN